MPYSSVSDLPASIKKKPPKQQRQWMAVFNSAYSRCMEDSGDGSACETAAFKQANGVLKGSEGDMPHQEHHEPGMMGMQMEKADSRVNYRECEPGDTQCCGNCRFFDAECAACDLVEGSIDASWKCSLWTARISGALGPTPAAWREPTFQVFVETAALDGMDFSKPQWIPFLPKPGHYTHADYGQLVVTAGQNREMVASVQSNVYQENIPIDAEHEYKLSGAVGWLKDMRMNDDGSADAFVEFTPRGRSLLTAGGYKYVSPEWYSDWRDPATNVVHRNVIIGGAITTRPFFKDKVLRALVASEAGGHIVLPEGRGVKTSEGDPDMPDPKDSKGTGTDPAGPKTFTEAEVKSQVEAAIAAAEAKAKEAQQTSTQQFTELTTRVEAAEKQAALDKAARESADARTAALEKVNRRQRFAELVAGRGGSGDGAPWVGDPSGNIEMLEGLADKFAEDDPIFVKFVEQQKAIAAQMATSNLFGERGSSGAGAASFAGDSVDAKLDELAKARRKADPSKTYEQHYSEVMESPEAKALYGQKPTRPGASS